MTITACGLLFLASAMGAVRTIGMRIVEIIRRFFEVRLAPDEVIYLTHVQIRAM